MYLGQTGGYFNKKTVIGSVTIALGTIIYSETHILGEWDIDLMRSTIRWIWQVNALM